MTTAAPTTMRIICRAKELGDGSVYEADVVPDLSVTELVAGLNEAGYLPQLAGGERWRIRHSRTDSDLTPNAKLDQSGVQDGDQLDFLRDSHGARR